VASASLTVLKVGEDQCLGPVASQKCNRVNIAMLAYDEPATVLDRGAITHGYCGGALE
jgi:hypothetical protein